MGIPDNILYIDTLGNGNGLRYNGYLEPILESLEKSKTDIYWLAANHINIDNFDFDNEIKNYTGDTVNVYGTNKFGDLFLINKKLIFKTDVVYQLAAFKFHIKSNIKDCNYEIIEVETDDFTSIIKQHKSLYPWYYIRNTKAELDPDWEYTSPNYWEGPRVETFGENNNILLVHKDVQIKEHVYDCPKIYTHNVIACKEPNLDVIFLSNGEYFAENNFDVLRQKCPKAIHLKGINGRANSYKAMAELSKTQWFFAVFAKLYIDKDFDFNWKPDRLQAPKHYIFKATNCLNKLEYGHMAIVAANKNLVLNTNDYGLDFTMSAPHAVVDMLSGLAVFNDSPYSTWRTAFRESVKLTYAVQTNSLDFESFDRLNTWLNYAEGPYSEYCIQGARDGFKYAKKNEGNLDALKLTREWSWLEQYFNQVHVPPIL